jgi:(p)ppGpp synthase/HD superfamily hydrolase
MATLERVITIAATAHAGAVDKANAPYISHPLRLMLTICAKRFGVRSVPASLSQKTHSQ